MIVVPMTPIHRVGLPEPIAGGWDAKIPSVLIANQSEAEVYRRYLRSRGHDALEAENELARAIDDVFTRGWVQGLRICVADRAKEYFALYGTLRGFDPAYVQSVYFPGENTGRRGKPWVRHLLVTMGADAGLKVRGRE